MSEENTHETNVEAGNHAAKSEASIWKGFVETSSRADVLRFLHAHGYLVATRTFYRHVRLGKLRKSNQGNFTAAGVKKYAAAWIAQPSGRTLDEEADDLAEMKLRAEIARIKTTQEREQYRLDVDQKKFIAADRVQLEIVGRAIALEAGFDVMIYTHCPEWITLVGGDPAKEDLLISSLMEIKNDLLLRYASMAGFNTATAL